MYNMKLRNTLLFTTMIFSAAQADSNFNRFTGQYVAVNAGAMYTSKIYGPNVTTKNAMGGGVNLYLGDQVTTYFAPELDFGYFSFGSPGGVGLLSLNARFTAPVGSSVSLFAKGGLGYGEVTTRLNTRVSASDIMPSFGLGVGFGFSPSSMVTLESSNVYAPHNLGNASGIMSAFTLGVTHYFAS
jgi:opacity protein-like surface antigen